jgi:hypothetical protein
MFLLILGIAAAFGMIAWIVFGLMSLANDDVKKYNEAYLETGDGEVFLSEEPA